MRDASQEALERACRALAHRDFSAAELRARLERAGFTDAACGEALTRLAQVGYVDDARYARNRAGVLSERGLGDAAIRCDLGRRGVARDLADAALAELAPEPERAALLAARLGGGPRATRALARKGFSGDSIESALGAGIADES